MSSMPYLIWPPPNSSSFFPTAHLSIPSPGPKAFFLSLECTMLSLCSWLLFWCPLFQEYSSCGSPQGDHSLYSCLSFLPGRLSKILDWPKSSLRFLTVLWKNLNELLGQYKQHCSRSYFLSQFSAFVS